MLSKPLDAVLLEQYDQLFAYRPGAIDYDEWIEVVEEAGLPTAERLAKSLAEMALRPKISIVMPVYNTDPVYLKACIDSVLAQSYPDWELCIADDASPKQHVRQILETYAAQDERIKVAYPR